MNKKRLTIYLSGGLFDEWKQWLMVKLQDFPFDFIDPLDNNNSNPAVYTPWDLFAINRSDIVLCRLTHDNPSGIGLAYEAGYAIAKGKHVITVIDREHPIARYFDIVRAGSSVDFMHLDATVDYLKTM